MPKPTVSKEIAIKEETSPLYKLAMNLPITNTGELTKSTELLSQLNRKLDAVTEEKEKITKPLNEALKAERGRWKPIETMLEEAILSIRKKQSAYQTEQVRIQREDQQKIADRVGEGKGKLKVETAIRKIDELDQPEKYIATESGSLKFRTDKILKITNVDKIPKQFWLVNETAVLKALKLGEVVPGAELEEIQTPINSR